MKKNLYLILGILSLLLVWTLLSILSFSNIAFPSIFDTLKALGILLITKSTYTALLYTIFRLLITVVISFVLALILSYFSYISKKFESFISPLISIMRTVPVTAIIIILLLLIGDNASLVITSFMVLPIIYEGALTSFKNIPKEMSDEVKMISNITPRIILKIYLPISLPYILSSLIQAIGMGLKVMVMSEFITQPKGSIGYMLFQERWSLNMDNVFAWTIILVVIVIVIDLLIRQSRKLQKLY